MGTIAPYGFIFVGSILLILGINLLWKGIRSKNWPKVKGTIRRSEVDVFHTLDEEGASQDFSADIYYEYAVEGQSYGGTTVKLNYGEIKGRGDSSRAIDKYPQGSTVDVYYDPEDPNRAALEPGIPLSTIVFLLLGPLFILIGGAIFLGT